MLRFEDAFFEGEIRNSFYIRPMIKRVWACQLDMVIEIDRICRKYGIRWFADWGTLLGAVREGGYIAWDDDLDISMTRKDFELFKAVSNKEFPEGWIIENERNRDLKNGMYDVIAHVRNSLTLRTDREYLQTHYGCPYVVCVDVFVYDNVPDDLTERRLFLTIYSLILETIWAINGKKQFDECSSEIQGRILEIESVVGKHFDHQKEISSQLYLLLDYVSAMYYKDFTKNVSQIGYLMSDEKLVFNREWFSGIEYKKFENIVLPVPVGYDEILKLWYGDYMIPKQYEAGHDYPYFKSQEKKLFDEYNRRGWKIPICFME